jgi:protein farnesyltransferase/geranylgeranyltransferase type-1 subunit alpha
VERIQYLNSLHVKAGAAEGFSKKAQKEFWKQVNEAGITPRRFEKQPTVDQFGKDKSGRNIGEYTIEEYNERRTKRLQLAVLETQSELFRNKRSRALKGFKDGLTGQAFVVEESDIAAERARRGKMAALRKDLYGERGDSFSGDPEWDDVVPIPQMEPEGALAAIAYPENYAEGMY